MSKTLFFSLCLVALGLLSFGNAQMMCDFSPCQNNATCVVGMYGEPICYCAYGFSGQYCEDSAFCTEDFCLNGGICRSIPELQFKTCECVGNYLGPRCEFEIFSAELKGVEAGTNSPNIGYVALGYFESDGVSRGASLIQIDLPDIVSAGIHMGPPGMNGPEILPFMVTNGTIEDLEMEVVPKFDLEALRNGGYYFVVRTLEYPQGEIRGQLGPWERECNLDCVNGFCYSVPFSPSVCECYPGYSGDLCEINECSSSPCQNNGTCEVGPYGLSICMCTDGYFGDYCEFESCPPDACMNGGTCYPGPFGPTCVCPEGFYGQYCHISMYCQTNICYNGGTCYNGMYGPYCACPSGFFGYQCEQSNNCSPGVCMNGGTCYNGMYGPFCSCPSGFFGSHCEQSNECSSNVCKNGGTCYPGTYGPACICPSGYSGQYCDQTNSCTPGTCMNGGTCYPGPYGPSCACPSGFMGYYCEQKDKCHPNPCMNGGYCSYDIYSQPTCTCPPSYTGEFCQTQKTNSFCTPNFDIPFVLFESIPADGLIPSGDMIELVFTKDLDCSLTSVFFWVGYYSKMLCYGNKLTIKLGSVSPGANIFFMWSAVSLYGDVDESFSFYQIDYNPCDTQDFCNQRGECIYTFGEIHCECIPGFSGFNCSETTFSVNIEVQTCDMPNAGTFGPVILSGYSGSSNSPAMIINELAQGSASYFSAVYPMGGYFQPEGVHVYLGSQDSWCIESITLEMSLLPKITVPVNKWLTPTNFYTAVEFDFCSVNPCEFGGCESHPFACTCPGAGIWTGEVCEDGNDCASNPCNAGNCTDLYFSYECTCPPEYLGANCESTNPCYGAPCTNGATCQVQGSSFVCNCPKGFSGDLCQTTIYDCQIHVLASVSAPTSANGLIKFNGNMGSTEYLSFGRFLTSGAIESRSSTSSVNIGELMSIDITSSKLTDAWGIESITCSAGNGGSKVFTIKNWISSANPNIHAE